MSKIQKQVRKLIKKTSQVFVTDRGLYSLGFNLLRRRNLSSLTSKRASRLRRICFKQISNYKRSRKFELRRLYFKLVRYAAQSVRFNPSSLSSDFFNLFDFAPVYYTNELKKLHITLVSNFWFIKQRFPLIFTNLNFLFSLFSRLYPGLPFLYLKYWLWLEYSFHVQPRTSYSHQFIFSNNFLSNMSFFSTSKFNPFRFSHVTGKGSVNFLANSAQKETKSFSKAIVRVGHSNKTLLNALNNF